MRDAMAHPCKKEQRRTASAWIGTSFAQDDAEAARKQWRQILTNCDRASPSG
jgi:putative transposase